MSRTPEQLSDQRLNNLRTKVDVIDAYGGLCACCGETEVAFLTIDHVDRDGAAHRKANGVSAGGAFYRWLKKNNYPTEPALQVLCYNCNCASFYRDECPHKSGINLRAIAEQPRRAYGPRQHGTISMYSGKGCRCEPCREAKRVARAHEEQC